MSRSQIPRVAPAGVIWEEQVCPFSHIQHLQSGEGLPAPLNWGHMFEFLWEICFFVGESQRGLN